MSLALTDYAGKINAREQAIESCKNEMIELAIAQGHDLIAVKAKLPHGEFETWCLANINVDNSQCRRYMRYAKHEEKLNVVLEERERIPDLVSDNSDLTMKDADALISETRGQDLTESEILEKAKVIKDRNRQIQHQEKELRIDRLREKETTAPTGEYDVIVIDPPWPMKKIVRDVRPNQFHFDYPVMEEDEIKAVHLPMADDCHVFCWTTHKFLPMALRCLEHWGLNYICAFVWHKNNGFQPFGLPKYNCEFALYARKGNPLFTDPKKFNVAFNAPQTKHSEKPEFFYDLIRRVTAGKRLDMFNRRTIDGFDTWGNESASKKRMG